MKTLSDNQKLNIFRLIIILFINFCQLLTSHITVDSTDELYNSIILCSLTWKLGREKNFVLKSPNQSKIPTFFFKLKEPDKVNQYDTKNLNTIIKQSYATIRHKISRGNYLDFITFAMSVLLIASQQIRWLAQRRG